MEVSSSVGMEMESMIWNSNMFIDVKNLTNFNRSHINKYIDGLPVWS